MLSRAVSMLLNQNFMLFDQCEFEYRACIDEFFDLTWRELARTVRLKRHNSYRKLR